MNPLDVALGSVMLISTGVGVMRGLVREVFGILSLTAALVLAYVLGPVLLGALAGATAGPIAYLVACAVVFALSLVGLALLGRFLRSVLRALHLGGLDRAGGGVFGLARALLITVSALTVLVLALDPGERFLKDSVLLRAHAPGVEWLGTRIPHERVRAEFERRWAELSPRGGVRVHFTGRGAGELPQGT